MTYVVVYLDWSKDDGTTLVFLLQASNALVTAASVCLSRYLQPQVTLVDELADDSSNLLIPTFCRYFYNRATLYIARSLLSCGVCPSVTSRYCV